MNSKEDDPKDSVGNQAQGEIQMQLALPAPAASDKIPMVPARMVNEYVYCPRLAYLMWAQGEWAESADTVDGKRVHIRADKKSGNLPEPEQIDEETERKKIISRSLTLSSDQLGIIAKLDIAEADNGSVIPVDYKRGKRPHVARGAYDPERIQVCLQAMLLEEHGYRVDSGAIYFAESRERVFVELDDELRKLALDAVNSLRLSVAQNHIPPPLKDSPKCPRCSLVGICLPDEIQSLTGSALAPRTIAVPADTALPLIVQSQRARIGKTGETLKIVEEDKKDRLVRLIDISELVLFGNVSITTPALTTLMEREIPVAFHSHGGWFRGTANGVGHKNVEVRTAQYKKSFSDASCLRFARRLVAAKIQNQRTILRRNWRGDEGARQVVLGRLKSSYQEARTAVAKESLLGIEGDAAACYFQSFTSIMKQSEPGAQFPEFEFESRNRRPPTDPVNALLSFAYAMLTRHVAVALSTVGLDPYRGFYHAMRYGRPALALDLMEPLRPVIADSVVLSAINNGEVRPEDFITTSTGCALKESTRRNFVGAFERRLSQETTHPIFGYRVSMRRLVLVQARLLTRYLLGEISQYPHYLPR